MERLKQINGCFSDDLPVKALLSCNSCHLLESRSTIQNTSPALISFSPPRHCILCICIHLLQVFSYTIEESSKSVKEMFLLFERLVKK